MPAGCGNHAAAEIGLLGKNIKVNGEVIEAVDVFAGGAAGCEPNPPIKIMEDVPCEDLANTVAGLVRHGAFKAMRQQLRKLVSDTAPPAAQVSPPEPAPLDPRIRPTDIPEGSAKLVRLGAEEIAVFKRAGELYAIQNICPHEGGQLSKGQIERDDLVCPLHRYRFNLKTGACANDQKLRARIFELISDGEEFRINFSQLQERI